MFRAQFYINPLPYLLMRFLKVAHTFERLEKTSGRLEMTSILAQLFKETSPEEIGKLVYILQGLLLPSYYGVDLGLGEKFVMEAISSSTGYSRKEVEDCYKHKGDLGDCAEHFVKNRRQLSLYKEELELLHVYDVMYKIATLSGAGSVQSKIKHFAELLNNAQPLEARYLVRYVLGRLRLGVGDPTILDALSLAKYGDRSWRDALERAYNICADLGLVARTFFESPEKIPSFKVQPFKPLMPALAERLSSPEEIIKKLGCCMVEMKYDGFRMQCHKQGERVEIYSRKLERMTHMFPDVVEEVRSLPYKEIIFEGEALAYNEREDRYYSFQETMHRRRKHGIEEASKEFPLRVFVFDVLYVDGVDFTLKPYKERRAWVEKFSYNVLRASFGAIAENARQVAKLFNSAIKKGLEGIMAKDLNAPYTAGKRKFAWIKLKKSYGKGMDTIDAVIVGYYLGRGARAQFEFGGVLVAVYNDEKDRLETIAKVASGFTEEEMVELKRQLEKITIPKKPNNLASNIEVDFWVEPQIVIEVAYDEITISHLHTAGKGYALRFPRFIQKREDKSLADITTVKEVEELMKGK